MESADPKAHVELACSTAEEFTKLYYENIDKKRLLIPKLYLDSAAIVWNGNGFSGKESIIKHLEDLPGSQHTVITLDAQKVPETATGNKLAFIIQVYGVVKYEIFNEQKSFHQNFMIIVDEHNKWKIASDCFRLQEPIKLFNELL